jgi:hypothetical protein
MNEPDVRDFEGPEQFEAFRRAVARPDSAVARFEAAVAAVLDGDELTLRQLLSDDPELIRARSMRSHHATLLNYVGANGVERQETPANVVRVATDPARCRRRNRRWRGPLRRHDDAGPCRDERLSGIGRRAGGTAHVAVAARRAARYRGRERLHARTPTNRATTSAAVPVRRDHLVGIAAHDHFEHRARVVSAVVLDDEHLVRHRFAAERPDDSLDSGGDAPSSLCAGITADNVKGGTSLSTSRCCCRESRG